MMYRKLVYVHVRNIMPEMSRNVPPMSTVSKADSFGDQENSGSLQEGPATGFQAAMSLIGNHIDHRYKVTLVIQVFEKNDKLPSILKLSGNRWRAARFQVMWPTPISLCLSKDWQQCFESIAIFGCYMLTDASVQCITIAQSRSDTSTGNLF